MLHDSFLLSYGEVPFREETREILTNSVKISDFRCRWIGELRRQFPRGLLTVDSVSMTQGLGDCDLPQKQAW